MQLYFVGFFPKITILVHKNVIFMTIWYSICHHFNDNMTIKNVIIFYGYMVFYGMTIYGMVEQNKGKNILSPR